VPAVFILSTGRVGTTSLIHLLNLSPKISAHHEPKPKLLKLLKRSFAEFDDDSQSFGNLFIRARCRLIKLAHDQRRIYVEATLLKYMAPFIAQQMPHAKFIHVHRHPGGVIRSGMRRGWYDDHPMDRYRPKPIREDPLRKQWRSLSPFEKNCWFWDADNRRFLDLAERIGRERVMRISYERLFGGDNDGAIELFRFIEVPPPDIHQITRSLDQPHNAQQGRDFPTYDKWNSTMRRTLDQIAGQTMSRLGYERPICQTETTNSTHPAEGTHHVADVA
jgi:hypothetical protein